MKHIIAVIVSERFLKSESYLRDIRNPARELICYRSDGAEPVEGGFSGIDAAMLPGLALMARIPEGV